jgi:major membrane immunogen (membrane-anchored lipoprotein)
MLRIFLSELWYRDTVSVLFELIQNAFGKFGQHAISLKLSANKSNVAVVTCETSSADEFSSLTFNMVTNIRKIRVCLVYLG